MVLFWLKSQDLKISKIEVKDRYAHSRPRIMVASAFRREKASNCMKCAGIPSESAILLEKTSTEYFYFISEELNIALEQFDSLCEYSRCCGCFRYLNTFWLKIFSNHRFFINLILMREAGEFAMANDSEMAFPTQLSISKLVLDVRTVNRA